MELTSHAKALLVAFRDFPIRFEATILQAVPLMDLPLSLREHGVPAAIAELEAAGLIRRWEPPADADAEKPHPQLCLKRYWPSGPIWERV